MAFKLQTNFDPAGDQPQAIEGLVKSLQKGYRHQTLLGVTGSGKTYTMSGGDLWPDRGIIPRVLTYIFSEFQRRSKKFSFELFVSFI